VSWILIGFKADPDPAFYLNADPDLLDPRSKASADLDPGRGQTLNSQKVEFLHEKYAPKIGNLPKTHLRRYRKNFK
jgi:hypothetical protein